jgi:hypothetical protein
MLALQLLEPLRLLRGLLAVEIYYNDGSKHTFLLFLSPVVNKV